MSDFNKVVIRVGTEFQQFLGGLTEAFLDLGVEVVVIGLREECLVELARLFPGLKTRCQMFSEPEFYEVRRRSSLSELVEAERKYGLSFNRMISMDRALGQSFIRNVPKFPRIGRNFEDSSLKQDYFYRAVSFYEEHVTSETCVLQIWPWEPCELVVSARNARSLFFTQVGFGDRYFWAERFITSEFFKSSLRKAKIAIRDEIAAPKREPLHWALRKMNADLWSLGSVLRRCSRSAVNDIKSILKGSRKKGSYRSFAWLPGFSRGYFVRRFLESGIEPTHQSLKEYKIAYFPLPVEPEVSLLQFSPEAMDVFQHVLDLAKTLPSNWKLVLKEHPMIFGYRDTTIYGLMAALPNVYWSKPYISSTDWLSCSDLAITMNGSVGIEAIEARVPLLHFTKNYQLAGVPGVYYVGSFELLEKNLKMIDEAVDSDLLNGRAARILSWAQRNVSVDLPNHAMFAGRTNERYPNEDLNKALRLLRKSAGKCFD